MAEELDILFEVRGRVGLVTLNRPKALNALSQAMCLAMHRQLDIWQAADEVEVVVVESAGDRAFCAGGDVVAVYKSGKSFKAGDPQALDWRHFFHDEYRMNSAIHHFQKPYISILDGITMGGGVGISVHGSHRIATEATLMAMPETGLGLIPEVGGGHFLPRLEGATGMFLALTGQRARAADCCYLGITQAFVPRDKTADLVARLVAEKRLDNERVTAIVGEYSQNPGDGKIEGLRDDIDRLFSAETLDQLLEGLKADGGEWAQGLAASLAAKSPMSMRLTFRQLKEGGKLRFNENMAMEYRIVNRILEGHDFYEGVRAILLDKDNAPDWQPRSLDDISDEMVAAHFVSLGENELKFGRAAEVS
jgi:enoyl-CoA hydratase/carnithine racemase